VGRGFNVPALESLEALKTNSGWTGSRAVEQVLERYASELGGAVKQMIEQAISPRSRIAILAERGFGKFNELVRLLGAKNPKQQQAVVALLGRSEAIGLLDRVDIHVSDIFLAGSDGAHALPVVVCAQEGFAFSNIVVEIQGPEAKA